MYIYKLVDPRDQAIRYIGAAADLKNRLGKHIRQRGTNTAKDEWIDELLSLGMKPLIVELEQATRGDYKSREMFWLGIHAGMGYNLLNVFGVKPAKKGKRLSDDTRTEIARLYETNEYTYDELAAKFDTSRTNIFYTIKGRKGPSIEAPNLTIADAE